MRIFSVIKEKSVTISSTIFSDVRNEIVSSRRKIAGENLQNILINTTQLFML